jgi:hypothetical protein
MQFFAVAGKPFSHPAVKYIAGGRYRGCALKSNTPGFALTLPHKIKHVLIVVEGVECQ